MDSLEPYFSYLYKTDYGELWWSLSGTNYLAGYDLFFVYPMDAIIYNLSLQKIMAASI